MAPDVCFAEAHSVGLGHVLELLALERAAEHLDRRRRLRRHERLPRHPADARVRRPARPAAARPRAARALRARPGRRLRRAAATPWPRSGRDGTAAGHRRRRRRASPRCGTSSSRRPTSSRSTGASSPALNSDPVLSTLVRSLVEFGHGCRVRVVAEGVETADEADDPAGPRRRLRPGLALRPAGPARGAECDRRRSDPDPASPAARVAEWIRAGYVHASTPSGGQRDLALGQPRPAARSGRRAPSGRRGCPARPRVRRRGRRSGRRRARWRAGGRW